MYRGDFQEATVNDVRRLRGHLDWVELPILLLVLIVGGGTWGFVEVAAHAAIFVGTAGE